jgi:hypothetical protein
VRRRERGVVLLFVMAAVAVLSVIAVELASRASVDVLLASRSGREAAFRRLSDSGAQVGRALLREPEAYAYDFLGERWNEGARFTIATAESAEVRVFDESGKLNVVHGTQGAPRLARSLGRLFEYLRRYEPGRTEELRDTETRVFGRLGLLPPKDGEAFQKPEPLVTLDGLREAGLSAQQVFGERGLSRFLTTFGDGKVNLNTAPRAVLYAMDEEIDVQLADRIAAYRGDPDGKPGVYKAFEDPKDLRLVDGVVERSTLESQTKVVRDLYSKLAGRLTVHSSAFSIRVRSRVLGREREAWSFFEPGREERAGEKSRRTLKRLAYEEILP